jgi:hypothetical protein
VFARAAQRGSSAARPMRPRARSRAARLHHLRARRVHGVALPPLPPLSGN